MWGLGFSSGLRVEDISQWTLNGLGVYGIRLIEGSLMVEVGAPSCSLV